MTKTPVLSVALWAAILSLGVCSLQAQPAGPGERPGKPKGNKSASGEQRVPGLSREEGQRLAAAREKAKDDPTVRSLKQALAAVQQQLENAMNAAMIAADPGLAPTLEKVKQSRDRAKGMRDRFESLRPEQREQLKSARETAKSDPEVVAAREKMKAADSPEARRDAGQAMHEAMKAAVTKQNPDLAPLLERLEPPKPRGPMGPRPTGQPGGPPPPPSGMDGEE
ncbi:MAG: hypothetical protein WEC73_01320 [Chthoniobacterales bacterium]